MKVKKYKRIKRLLQNIFIYYQKKYRKLKYVKLSFRNNRGCFFKWGIKNLEKINIDLNYLQANILEEDCLLRYDKNLSFRQFIIMVFLHEIGHCKDYFYDRHNYLNKAEKQHKLISENFGWLFISQYDLPLEKDADRFAKLEFSNWEKVKITKR